MTYNWETFGISIATNIVIFGVIVGVFLWLRSTLRFRRFYAPRYYVKAPGYRRPKPLNPGFFNFIRCLFSYSEDEILAVAGYDGLVYLSIFRFGIELFGVLSLVILAAVLPVNWTGDLVDINREDRRNAPDKDERDKIPEVTNFDKITMANVEDEESVLWVHLIAVWFVTIYTLSTLYKYHKRAVDLRIEYLASTKKGGRSHTIFVTDIPGIRFGHPLDRLMHSILFKFLPGAVKEKIQSSLEAMSNMASTGMGALGAAATSAVSRGQAMLTDGSSRNPLLDQADDDALETFVRPIAKEITDMDPDQWIRNQLSQDLTHEQVVERMYREVFPEGEICCANMIMNTATLEPLVAKLYSSVQALEDLLDQYAISIRKNEEFKKAMVRVIPIAEGKWATEKYGQKPVKIDKLDYLVQKIRDLKRQIQEEDGKAKSQVTASAFVVFNTRWSQVVGASAFFHHFEPVWNAQEAPNPREVVWDNLKWRSWERSMRRVTVWFLFFLLCCFFLIPIGAIQALIKVDELENYAVIGDIVKFPLVNSLLKSIVPNLVLEIFLALLPMILAVMNHYQGFISRSAIDTEVTRKFFIFLIIIVFMVNFTAQSVLQQLDAIVEDPGSIVDLLAASAPQASTFFFYFIMTQTFISGAVDILNIPGLVLMMIFTMLAGTQRAKDRIWQSKPLSFGAVVSRHTFTLFLGVVFAVVNPFILPMTFFYCVFMMLYNRYKLLYVFSENYQSGGQVWNQIYEQVIVGLLFHHLMMLGLLGLKRFPYALFILPMPILTIFFKISVDKQFKRPLTLLSLRAARDLDARDQALEKRTVDEQKALATVHDAYVHEAFKIDWAQIEASCGEVPRVQDALEKPYEEAAPLVEQLNIRDAAEFYPIDSFALSKSDIETADATPVASRAAGGASGEELLKK